jgi:plastocyanin
MRLGCWLGKALALGFVAATVAVCAIVLSARPSVAREIRVVARGMTFYLDGGTDPNPTLRLRAGEEVRLVFRNDDAGLRHDFTIPEWGVVTKRVEGKGETSVTFRTPDRPTTRVYQCTPHSAMMKGTIAVE